MGERIELRCTGGPLLGVLIVGGVTLEVKRGHKLYEVDLRRTLAEGAPVVRVRTLTAGNSVALETTALPK